MDSNFVFQWRKAKTREELNFEVLYKVTHIIITCTGLKRNGKSCRLRWVNYLRPDLKRGQITPHEESIIVELHARWGNR